jgi:hypothetical protein
MIRASIMAVITDQAIWSRNKTARKKAGAHASGQSGDFNKFITYTTRSRLAGATSVWAKASHLLRLV